MKKSDSIKTNANDYIAIKSGNKVSPNDIALSFIGLYLNNEIDDKKFDAEDFFQYTEAAQRKILNFLLFQFTNYYKHRNQYLECKTRTKSFIIFFNSINFEPFANKLN